MSGFVLRQNVSAPTGGLRPHNTPTVAWYCNATAHTGGYNAGYFHENPGAWLHCDVRRELTAALQRARTRPDPEDIVIQFRCGDNCGHPDYGLLTWPYYFAALHRHVGARGARVLIIRSPGRQNGPVCDAVLRGLALCIQQFFAVTPRVREARSLLEDVATMMYARVFVASISTLGLYAGAGSHGVAYVPQSKITGGGRRPCFGRIRWIAGERFPCLYERAIPWQNLTDYFLRPVAHRNADLRRRVAEAMGGARAGRAGGAPAADGAGRCRALGHAGPQRHRTGRRLAQLVPCEWTGV